MPSELDRKFDDDAGRGHRARRAAGHRPGRAGPRNRRQFPGHASDRSSAPFARSMRPDRGGGCGRRAADLRRSRPDFGTAWRTALVSARNRARATASASRCATARPGSSATWRSLKAGGVATLLNGWWEAARDGACARPGRAEADHRRCAAREADRRRLRRRRHRRRCRSSGRSSEALRRAARRRR